MTDYKMTILINSEEAEGHSNLYFDVVRNDTIRNDYYGLNKVVNKNNILSLNSRECYKISYKVSYPETFVQARIYVKYIVRSSTPRLENYRKVFDLNEVRSKAYTQF